MKVARGASEARTGGSSERPALRSATPGRSRWTVPGLVDNEALARTLEEALQRHPDVLYACANTLTGRILMRYWTNTALARVESWLGDALSRVELDPPASGPREVSSKPRRIEPRALAAPKPALQRLVQPYARQFTVAAWYSTWLAIFEMGSPLIFGLAIQFVMKGPRSGRAVLGLRGFVPQYAALTGLLYATMVLEVLTRHAAAVRWKALGQDIQHDLRQQVYRGIQQTDMAYLGRYDTGTLASILQEDIPQIELFVGSRLDEITRVLATTVAVNATLWVYVPEGALFNLLLLPAAAWLNAHFRKQLRWRYRLMNEAAARLSGRLVGNLEGLTTISAFGTEEFEARRIRDSSGAVHRSSLHASQLSSASAVPMQTLLGLASSFTTLLLGHRVYRGRIGVGAYTMIGILNKRMLWYMNGLGNILDQYQRTTSAVERVLAVREEWPRGSDGWRTLDSPVQGRIELREVDFHYQSSRPVLHDLTLTFPPGKTTAVVGPTGSGKSTLVKLLLRFHEPVAGEISIDGVELSTLRVESLRRSIGLVGQDNFLFDGSIADNIAYGATEADPARVREAARVAAADEFISALPEGYATRVGERGAQLSGGQRQRIAIARAIYRDAPILILDEATSSVDNKTELAIQQALRRASIGKTTLLIAHRLSTVRHADVIHVLRQGRVVESGTHDELLARRGEYHQLWLIQTGELVR